MGKGKFHFRPYISSSVEENDDNIMVQDNIMVEQSLLWVHQTDWQREILAKYGNTMSLIDATYKTTKYDVPLFFVTVRTNAGYTVVAEFIVQTETVICIEEALGVLKKWNPNWNPKFFMCDYSEAEISSIEAVFPEAVVYICDFHREQCWERWIKDHKHGLSKSEGSQLLDLLRSCAFAPPVCSSDQDSDFNYQIAVKSLIESEVWLENDQVQDWLNKYWLPIAQVLLWTSYDEHDLAAKSKGGCEISTYIKLHTTGCVCSFKSPHVLIYCTQRWARAYRDQVFHECINTNNGTESLNKALKYTYLPRAKRSTNLSGIVTTLIDIFLPALRQKYLFSNFEQSTANRQYKDNVPTYLQNRPKSVILHCLDRRATSCQFLEEDVCTTPSKGVFEVKSGENVYKIDFQAPSCTCPDWILTNYPCKHFFAVFRIHSSWDWNALPPAYLDSPRMKLDSKALENYFCPSRSPECTVLHDLHENGSNDFTENLTKRKVSTIYMS